MWGDEDNIFIVLYFTFHILLVLFCPFTYYWSSIHRNNQFQSSFSWSHNQHHHLIWTPQSHHFYKFLHLPYLFSPPHSKHNTIFILQDIMPIFMHLPTQEKKHGNESPSFISFMSPSPHGHLHIYSHFQTFPTLHSTCRDISSSTSSSITPITLASSTHSSSCHSLRISIRFEVLFTSCLIYFYLSFRMSWSGMLQKM